MSEVLLAQWRDRVVECTSEICIVEEDIRAVQAQRQSLKQQIRLYEDNVQKEKTELLAKLEDVEARARDLGERCEATLRLKEEVERIYVNTLDEYENMHYLVREIKNEEDALSAREGLEVRLQRESLAWADEEHSLRRKLGTLTAELRRARQTQLAEVNEAEAMCAAAEQRQRAERLRHQRSRSKAATATLPSAHTALPQTWSGDSHETPDSMHVANAKDTMHTAASPITSTTATRSTTLHRHEDVAHATQSRSRRNSTTEEGRLSEANAHAADARHGSLGSHTVVPARTSREAMNHTENHMSTLTEGRCSMDGAGAALTRSSGDNSARASAANHIQFSSHQQQQQQQQQQQLPCSKYTSHSDVRCDQSAMGGDSSALPSAPLKSCIKSSRTTTAAASRENSTSCVEPRWVSVPSMNHTDHVCAEGADMSQQPRPSRTEDMDSNHYRPTSLTHRADGVRSAPTSRAVSQTLVSSDVPTAPHTQPNFAGSDAARFAHTSHAAATTRSAPAVSSSSADLMSNISLDALQQRIRAYSQAASKGASGKRDMFDDHTNE